MSNDNELTPTRGDAPAVRTSSEGGGPGGRDPRDTRALLPRVDVLEDTAGITLLADLPGVSKERLELKVEGDTLLIEGEVGTPMPPQMQSVHAEIRVPRYRRAFTLSRELDSARIEASMKDGVLRLRIPKQEHARPRRIEVRAT
ncbi:MAG TPA: Hsp20/alpha crystallin family protein [Burkholderiaceae bacterium]